MHVAYSIADQAFGATASTGIYNISTGLLRALSGREDVELTVLSNPEQADLLREEGLSGREISYAVRWRAGRVWWEQYGICRAAKRTGADWLFLPKGFMPVRGRVTLPVAAYVHDLIPLYTVERYGGGGGTARELRQALAGGRSYDVKTGRLKYAYFRACYRATLRRAAVIFTNTEFTRRELMRRAKIENITPPPIIVAGYGFHAPGDVAQERRNRILVMVRDDPHKRADLTLEYMRRWREETNYRGEVLFLGRLPEGMRMPAHPGWLLRRRVPAEQCLRLMSDARALVHFSEYEGFGMPPVEAALHGACPVFSDVPATMEAMGRTGCPFHNDDYASFAAAMQRALECSPQLVRTWARELIQRHDWKEVARRVREGMEGIHHKEKGRGSDQWGE